MDDLPPHLVVEILSRIGDSTDLAACRLVSKTLNSLSREVRSVNLTCTLSRYLKSRSPETCNLLTPFKTIFNGLILRSRGLDSVTVGVDKSFIEIPFDDDEYDESDDLYLTDVAFVKEWLPKVCGELRSLSISDFWIQSCWRSSKVLVLISSCCSNLRELKLKNTWLSVDGLNPMPTLTNLTLEHVRLDDKDLGMVNNCFPSLQVLNLVGVGGLETPTIRLLHLKSCLWNVSNAPYLLAIIAPNLVTLKLTCIRPRSLILHTPLLSDFYLSLEKAEEIQATDLCNLKTLELESLSLDSVLGMFPSGKTVKKLTLESLKKTDSVETKFGLEVLFDLFPNLCSLNLGPGAWTEAEIWFRERGLKGASEMESLEKIIGRLVVNNLDVTISFIHSLLDKCTKVSDMTLLLQEDSWAASSLISRCAIDHPRIRWRWGTWKEGSKDTWISNGV
ncbi:hypothetical protein SLEP1_g23102 [Rubroshorea leprosula]|uniref:F-box domain-containing protein n=1 Tax=Rubroshorea leprosula TaxID=152421 RepID=A0AAV5JKM8_9ROSI|nr:hypothetical protein SLEP1_g23102 [Rubroshorea leprosula]